ncbi:unnamed protein product [Mycena citricolor]|uniref:Uncharacterized protein n=1 Tax=Mycena citricolor TaxID=2018698 RepID=A0AAD2HN63_9AGAR|nr:unnamed protein product [Mycena citricolor]
MMARNAALMGALGLKQAAVKAMGPDGLVEKAKKPTKRKMPSKELAPEKRRQSSRLQSDSLMSDSSMDVDQADVGDRSGLQDGGDFASMDVDEAGAGSGVSGDAEDLAPLNSEANAPSPKTLDNATLADEGGSEGGTIAGGAAKPDSDAPEPHSPPAPDPQVPTTRPRCPDKAAVWFQNAHKKFMAVDLGPDFDAVVTAWMRVEDASRYAAGDEGISSNHRPAAVTTWIRRKRTKIPSIPDTDAYPMQWEKWWTTLQPEWRVADTVGGAGWSRVEYGAGGREWGPLYRWGPNGAQNLVAAFYFWGLRLRESSTSNQIAVWNEAVQDLGWMLEGLASFYELWKKLLVVLLTLYLCSLCT